MDKPARKASRRPWPPERVALETSPEAFKRLFLSDPYLGIPQGEKIFHASRLTGVEGKFSLFSKSQEAFSAARMSDSSFGRFSRVFRPDSVPGRRRGRRDPADGRVPAADVMGLFFGRFSAAGDKSGNQAHDGGTAENHGRFFSPEIRHHGSGGKSAQ